MPLFKVTLQTETLWLIFKKQLKNCVAYQVRFYPLFTYDRLLIAADYDRRHTGVLGMQGLVICDVTQLFCLSANIFLGVSHARIELFDRKTLKNLNGEEVAKGL